MIASLPDSTSSTIGPCWTLGINLKFHLKNGGSPWMDWLSIPSRGPGRTIRLSHSSRLCRISIA